MPNQDAGTRMDPPVSVPGPPRQSPAAIAAPVPLEEPPGERSKFHGLCVSPNVAFVPDTPAANSFMLVLPRTTTPASKSFRTTVASRSVTRSLKAFDPTVVRVPRISKRSLTTIGTPCSRPRSLPARSSSSRSVAVLSASSLRTAIKALSCGSSFSTPVRYVLVRSNEVRSPLRNRFPASAIVVGRSAALATAGAALSAALAAPAAIPARTVRRVGESTFDESIGRGRWSGMGADSSWR